MSLIPDLKSVLRGEGVDYLGASYRDRRKLFKKEKRRLRRRAAARRRASIRRATAQLSESIRTLDEALSSLRGAESRLEGCRWGDWEREFLSGLDEKNKKKSEDVQTLADKIVSEHREHTKNQVPSLPSLTHIPFSPIAIAGAVASSGECEFFLRTGACKFGDGCRYFHPRPSASDTLILPHLFSGAGVSSWMVDGREGDVELENDEGEVYQRFLDFHADVYHELARFGEVLRFEVCSNQEFHLRGSVFVRFRSPEAAGRCREALNGRWYDRRLVSCELSCVRDFGRAICQVETAGRLSQSRKFKVCMKGKNCNFWHVFRKAHC